MGHIPSRSHPRSQYPSERLIEDPPLARLNWVAAQEHASSFGSQNERRGLHQVLQACGDSLIHSLGGLFGLIDD